MALEQIGDFLLKYFVVISLFISLISGMIGYFVKNQIDKKKELLNEVNKERRKAYQDFINLVVDLFANIKSEDKKENSEFIPSLYSFYKKNILFASPKVVNSFSDYMQFIFHYDTNDKRQHFEHILKLTEVMKAMREDIGLSNKDLGKHGENLMRAIINDFDKLKNNKEHDTQQ